MELLTLGAFLPSGPRNLALPQEARAGSCPEDSRKFSATSVTKHVCLQFGCSRHRTAGTPSFCDFHILQILFLQLLTSMLVENAVNRHSCANIQKDCNFTDCHPSFPVDPFDHHATSTLTIVVEAAITIAFHCLPRLGIITCVKNYFSLSFAPMLAQWSAS